MPENPNIIDLDSIKKNMEFFGRDIETDVIGQTDSTNNVALSLLASSKAAPFAVLALEQKAGRGRLGRKWFGAPNASILMSVAVSVPKSPVLVESFTVRAGLNICDRLSEMCNTELFLKWPNDIYSREGLKIAGMLAELKMNPKSENYAVVFGVGLNYDFSRIPQKEIPEEIADTLCDLKSRCGAESMPGINTVAAAMIDSIVRAAEESDISNIRERFLLRDWLRGKAVEVSVGDELFEGIATGIDDKGRLAVLLPDGSLRHVIGGEATFKK